MRVETPVVDATGSIRVIRVIFVRQWQFRRWNSVPIDGQLVDDDDASVDGQQVSDTCPETTLPLNVFPVVGPTVPHTFASILLPTNVLWIHPDVSRIPAPPSMKWFALMTLSETSPARITTLVELPTKMPDTNPLTDPPKTVTRWLALIVIPLPAPPPAIV